MLNTRDWIDSLKLSHACTGVTDYQSNRISIILDEIEDATVERRTLTYPLTSSYTLYHT